MRRSFRDAIVGFSIIGGIITFSGAMLWLRGIRLGAESWSVSANFENASGLSERSPITYRGILVGSVGEISIQQDAVQAKLNIDEMNLVLPKPVFAKIVNSSLLGGDVQVELVSLGENIPKTSLSPVSENCKKEAILCSGDSINGGSRSSISSLTEGIDKIVKEADGQEVIKHIVESTKQFDKTQKELEDLIIQAREELIRAEPIISELNKASVHIRNILAAIDNPKTLQDIQKTAENTRAATAQIDEIGKSMSKIMSDKELMRAFRSVTIGLGQLFDEIYPAKTKMP